MTNQEGSLEEIQETPPQTSVHVQRLIDLKEKGQDRSHQYQYRRSIHMVPRYLRDSSPSSYRPRVVAIGPLHKNDEILKEFEGEKAICLHSVLDCSGFSPKQVLEACLRKVNASIVKIRACYVGMKTYRDDELAEMMVIDAFFLLDIFSGSSRLLKLIKGNDSLSKSITIDVLLLENQIPFFVLQDIYDTLINSMPTSHISDTIPTSLISNILRPFDTYNFFLPTRNDVVGITPDHILGLLQNSFHPKHITSSNDMPLQPTFNSSLELESFVKIHHSALELDKAGMKFKPDKDKNWQMAMKFQSSWFGCFSWWCCCNPTLRMPVMVISDDTEQHLRNMIAYEQCTPSVPNYISSYIYAMDALVDTTDDLIKLVESKVIINMLGSNEEAKNMINNICKNIVIKEFYYKEQWHQLDQYYNGYWPRHIAWLKRKYFSNPWTVMALLATFILFGLSITQTIFTITGASAK